jgi:hypothetical protein
MWVESSTVKVVAALAPKLTAVAPAKPVPVIVTDVPPTADPLFGLTDVTVGGGVKMNWSSGLVALVPPAVVTVMSTVPDPAGLVADICVELSTVKIAALPPKLTSVAPVRSVPVMVTAVPPAAGPLLGVTPVTVGATTSVKSSAPEVALVPPGVTTLTSTVPVRAGLVAVIWVELSIVKLVAAVRPKLTALAPPKFVPVMVTDVPPLVGPALGATALTAGW